jgi:hypothetical protein
MERRVAADGRIHPPLVEHRLRSLFIFSSLFSIVLDHQNPQKRPAATEIVGLPEMDTGLGMEKLEEELEAERKRVQEVVAEGEQKDQHLVTKEGEMEQLKKENTSDTLSLSSHITSRHDSSIRVQPAVTENGVVQILGMIYPTPKV